MTTKRDEWINKQRVSIKFKDAKKWGYGSMDTESAMGLLSFGGYCHPKTFNHMVLMLDEFTGGRIISSLSLSHLRKLSDLAGRYV